MLSLIACCYLLFRRANAIAPDVTSPKRLRRWTAAFFASATLCHLWYLPMYFLTSSDDMMQGSLIAGLLDSMTVIPLTIVVLLTMLQDRRRPLGKAKEWPLYDLKDRRVMVLDEFDIHPEKESELKIVDWERTFFLTNYYMP